MGYTTEYNLDELVIPNVLPYIIRNTPSVITNLETVIPGKEVQPKEEYQIFEGYKVNFIQKVFAAYLLAFFRPASTFQGSNPVRELLDVLNEATSYPDGTMWYIDLLHRYLYRFRDERHDKWTVYSRIRKDFTLCTGFWQDLLGPNQAFILDLNGSLYDPNTGSEVIREYTDLDDDYTDNMQYTDQLQKSVNRFILLLVYQVEGTFYNTSYHASKGIPPTLYPSPANPWPYAGKFGEARLEDDMTRGTNGLPVSIAAAGPTETYAATKYAYKFRKYFGKHYDDLLWCSIVFPARWLFVSACSPLIVIHPLIIQTHGYHIWKSPINFFPGELDNLNSVSAARIAENDYLMGMSAEDLIGRYTEVTATFGNGTAPIFIESEMVIDEIKRKVYKITLTDVMAPTTCAAVNVACGGTAVANYGGGSASGPSDSNGKYTPGTYPVGLKLTFTDIKPRKSGVINTPFILNVDPRIFYRDIVFGRNAQFIFVCISFETPFHMRIDPDESTLSYPTADPYQGGTGHLYVDVSNSVAPLFWLNQTTGHLFYEETENGPGLGGITPTGVNSSAYLWVVYSSLPTYSPSTSYGGAYIAAGRVSGHLYARDVPGGIPDPLVVPFNAVKNYQKFWDGYRRN